MDFILTVRVQADDREDAGRMGEVIEERFGGLATVANIEQEED